MLSNVLPLLNQGLAKLPFVLPISASETILTYLQFLEKWNCVHNLTAVRNINDQVRLHVLDCLALIPAIDRPWRSIADIGTGAGLPGIMLALARPEWPILLVESNGKKVAFLREVVRHLNLKNVQVIGMRAEKWQPTIPIELILSRAVTSIDSFLRISRHLGDEESVWGLMKAYDDEQCSLAGFSKKKVVSLDVPLLDAPRLWIEVLPERVDEN